MACGTWCRPKTSRRSLSRRSLLRVGAGGAAGLSAALALACGGGDGKPKAGEAPAPAATPAQAVEPPARLGGIYQGVLAADIPTTDPFRHVSYLAQTHAGFAYSKLLKFTTGPGVVPTDFEAAPDLAESWQAPDPLTYVFRLRPDARFHDVPPVGGRLVDASDVAFSFNRFLAVSPRKANLAPVIERVETPDPRTAVVKLKKPDADFIQMMADSLGSAVWIFPREAESYDAVKTVIGSGPWLFEGQQPSIAISYKRNPDYFLKDAAGRPLPYMAGVKLLIVPEYAQRLAQFMAGNIHVLTPQAPDVKAARAAIPGHQLLPDDMPTTYHIFGFRPIGPGSTSPFNDERVRRAVSMAVDRDGLIKVLSNEDFYTAEGLTIDKRWHNYVTAGLNKWWLDPKAALQKGEDWAKWYKYDVAEAKKLLAAAGYANGFEAEYHRTTAAYGTIYDDAAEALVAMLNAVGIRTRVQVHDYASKFVPELLTKGDFTGIGNFLQSFAVLGLTLFGLYHPDGSFNRNKWNDPLVLDLLAKQSGETDYERRRALVHELQRHGSTTMHNVPLLQQTWNTWVMAWPFVKNWRLFRVPPGSYAGGTEALIHLWLDK
jgi:ABC-type transport system substrate-binding protein